MKDDLEYGARRRTKHPAGHSVGRRGKMRSDPELFDAAFALVIICAGVLLLSIAVRIWL